MGVQSQQDGFKVFVVPGDRQMLGSDTKSQGSIPGLELGQ